MGAAMDDASSDSTAPGSQSNGRGPGEGAPDSDDGAPSRPPEAGHVGPIYSPRVLLLVGVVAVMAVAAMTWVYLSTVDGDDTAAGGVGQGDPGVERVLPAEGSQVPGQATVALDLTPGWDGRLSINGTPVPESELTRSSEEIRANPDPDRLELVPGADRTFETLPSGDVCVEAELWQRADGQDGERHTHEWCFTVF